jgi:hypothetical protein
VIQATTQVVGVLFVITVLSLLEDKVVVVLQKQLVQQLLNLMVKIILAVAVLVVSMTIVVLETTLVVLVVQE